MMLWFALQWDEGVVFQLGWEKKYSRENMWSIAKASGEGREPQPQRPFPKTWRHLSLRALIQGFRIKTEIIPDFAPAL